MKIVMKKKALFIDRDGTLIKEPEDFQVDAVEKLDFLPGVITELARIAKQSEFELIMVTNQDGLGTEAHPEANFWPLHDLMLRVFSAEGVDFDAVHIDRSFAHEGLPTRKPGTAMLSDYFDYDLAGSYVIGDRLTDMALARNLGAAGILINYAGLGDAETDAQLDETIALRADDWKAVSTWLLLGERRKSLRRTTNETDITITLDLDGTGVADVATGIGFFDHMLAQIAKHGGIDLALRCKGDLEVDEHHTVEDVALALGEAVREAIGDKTGLSRYGFVLPMDDCLAQVAVDFGGRPWLVWEAEFRREYIGKMPTELFFHFFNSFSDTARCNLNVRADGQNEHHKIEAIFKGFARALRMALQRDVERAVLPTTKGVL